MANDCIPLPKGSLAIAHVEHTATHLHTGRYHWSRFYIVKVMSADRDGRVKTFADSPEIERAPKAVGRTITIYSLPPQYLEAAAKVYAKQALDFLGYLDKEHLRLALVNVTARETLEG